MHTSKVHHETLDIKRRADTHIRNQKVECKKCKTMFENEVDLRKHNELTHPDWDVISECEDCDMEFKSVSTVENSF